MGVENGNNFAKQSLSDVFIDAWYTRNKPFHQKKNFINFINDCVW